jgi:rhamnulokinase
MQSGDILLAVDLGASSGRVLAASATANGIHLEEVHRFPNGPVAVGRRTVWNVLELWTQIETGLAKASAKYGKRIRSIGVDTWGVDYVLLDRNDDLVGPAFCYRDARTSGILDKAFARLSRAEIFAESGLQFMEFNTAYQLLAMRLEQSPLLDVAAHFLMIPDFFNWMLSGIKCNEYTNASTTQLMRPSDGKWSNRILGAFDIPRSLFSDPAQPGHRLGLVQSRVAEKTGLSGVEVIAPATHDTGSAVLAVPANQFSAQRPDWCYISSGTWSLMGVEIAEPNLSQACLARNFTNEGGAMGSVRLLKNISGLWPFQQCREAWLRTGQEFTWQQLVEMAEHAAPHQSLIDPDDPRFVAPSNMVSAFQSFYKDSGQTVLSDPGAIARSALESLAMRYRVCLGWLEELLGYSIESIYIVGGGVQNKLLCQMTADACNRIVIAGPVEATAIGNVMMQQVGLGQLGSILEARQMLRASTEMISYSPRASSQWDDAFGRFQKIMVKG